MASGPNYRLLAINLGEELKWDTSVNEIDRFGGAVVGGTAESFPVTSITSVRAQTIYNWVCTLGRRRMTEDERHKVLIEFVRHLTKGKHEDAGNAILIEAGLPMVLVNRENYDLFAARDYHPEVVRHTRKLFVQGHYFHAVFEAAKAYHQAVKEKAQLGTSSTHGQALMQHVWSEKSGTLRVNTGETQSEKDEQAGIMHLATGLMSAIRNPTSHEPALDWPIKRDEALELLSFISYLLRQVDRAVFVPRTPSG